METKLNDSWSCDSSDVQDLLKMLKDRTCELQSLKNRREEISQQIHLDREEMDRRTLLLLYMDEGLMDALMKLDAVKKEQQKLDQQIHELTTRSTERSKVSLSQLQKQEATLLEEENQLKLQRENLKKALEDAQKNTQKGPEFLQENQTPQTDASRNETAAKPGRKRAARR
ncbi:uncharacterized protein si:ch211-167j6.3 [Pygocentrus nattereri]|uniref:uncharacterized protein si:ch211-167j6.3 n=1 Tax=Pygocentrus nattereri TaxID=42514 RepID=UPI001890DF51|nr:uncharacterized protein si:ch211-167j6.3 [Pygocentrus nattereri]XP_037394895.1 uncharacterized protein si:ch211-167j6.3 [Pygocentrus nattereri]